jgi:hypothetical protein
MYFHNKLIWSHKYEYYLLKTWSNMKYFNWHAYYSYILLGTEVVYTMTRTSLWFRAYSSFNRHYQLLLLLFRASSTMPLQLAHKNSQSSFCLHERERTWEGKVCHLLLYMPKFEATYGTHLFSLRLGLIPLSSCAHVWDTSGSCLFLDILFLTCGTHWFWTLCQKINH